MYLNRVNCSVFLEIESISSWNEGFNLSTTIFFQLTETHIEVLRFLERSIFPLHLGKCYTWPIFLLKFPWQVTLSSGPLIIFSPQSVQPSMLLTSSFNWNIPFLWYQDITSPCFLFLCLICTVSPVSYSSFTHTSSVGVPQDSAPRSLLFSVFHLVHSCCFGCRIYRQPWNLYLKLRILFRSSDWGIVKCLPDLLDVCRHLVPWFPKFSYYSPSPKLW